MQGRGVVRSLMISLLLIALFSGLRPATSTAASSGDDISGREARGLALAKSRCSGCHSVVSNGTSPNPEAPSFEDVANRAGVTRGTMRRFLSDSHNYPAAMGFKLKAPQVAELSDYMLTLQRPEYRPIM
jgi:mono/diheme cytochrome c family protein